MIYREEKSRIFPQLQPINKTNDSTDIRELNVKGIEENNER